MKHELRQFLEKEYQSYDDLKGLSERLKTSATAIETMIAPDSEYAADLAGVNKSAANLILSALFQGKPYESGEYKPQKSIDWPFGRSELLLERANGLEELKQLAEQIRLRNNDRLDKPTDQDAINAVKKQLEDNGIAILSIESGPCKMPKTKEITLDLSQPIKEIERLNKELGKTIDKMSQIPPELLGTGMDYQTYEHTDGRRFAFPEIKADEVKKELEKRNAVEKATTEQENKGDLWLLDEVLKRTKGIKNEACESDILTKDLAEGQNIIATILQKRLQNGNI